MRTISIEERRARLGLRHRLAPSQRAETVEEAAESVVGLHATDLSSVHLSAWARVRDLRHEDVERALHADRSLIIQMAMRGTLFAFRRAILPAALHGAGVRAGADRMRVLARRIQQAGLTIDGTAWLEEAATAVTRQLDAGAEATWAELREVVPQLAVRIRIGNGETAIGPQTLTALSACGRIARGRNRGGWKNNRPSWTSVEGWLGGPVADVEPDAARAELVTRWLRAFGPGTEADLRWWLGDTQANVRAALRAIDAVEVRLEGHDRPGYLLPDDVDPPPFPEPWAALLPVLDPTTMGWQERDWYLGPHRSLIFDGAGNGGTTAWWNGRIVGGWHQLDDGRVEVLMLERVGDEASAALEAEATRLTEWLAGDQVGSRWGSPLVTGQRRRVRPA